MICEFHDGPWDGLKVPIDEPPLLIVAYHAIGVGAGGTEAFDRMVLAKFAYEVGTFSDQRAISYYFTQNDDEILDDLKETFRPR